MVTGNSTKQFSSLNFSCMLNNIGMNYLSHQSEKGHNLGDQGAGITIQRVY